MKSGSDGFELLAGFWRPCGAFIAAWLHGHSQQALPSLFTGTGSSPQLGWPTITSTRLSHNWNGGGTNFSLLVHYIKNCHFCHKCELSPSPLIWTSSNPGMDPRWLRYVQGVPATLPSQVPMQRSNPTQDSWAAPCKWMRNRLETHADTKQNLLPTLLCLI